jgi:UDPglucose 6-dehydrogenase
MRIAMVGTGYVGLVTGTCLANTGHEVTCVDVDQARIDDLGRGRVPLYEPGLEELIHRNANAGRLTFSVVDPQVIQGAQLIFVCVGTPADETGRSDLRYVEAAATDIADAIEAGPGPTGGQIDETDPKVVVIKSTVPVGTGMVVRDRIAARTGKPFCVASNPEFLKEGAALSDFNKPDRVVIGVEDEHAARVLSNLYEPFVRQGNAIFVMDVRSSEMVKYASNAMLATKISFINEMANLCEVHGADIDRVRSAMCADQRIGNQFLYPGLGYGGSCFPKDVLAVMAMGREGGLETPLLEAVHLVNQRQRQAFVAKIDRHFAAAADGPIAPAGEGATLAGRTFAIWGIAFKPGTDDIREAPSITIIEHLLDHGAQVAVHDPVAHESCHRKFADRVSYAPDPIAAVVGADALVICTDWGEFKHPDFAQIRRRMRCPVIFDGRNLYRRNTMKEQGFTYYCVGREPVVSADLATDARR